MAAHAKLSCSAASRWINCPGSVRAAEQFPSGSTIYADEGTLAHAMAEQILNTQTVTKAHMDKVDAFYADHPELGAESAEKMRRCLTTYIDTVDDAFHAAYARDPAAAILTEQKVSLEKWIPGGFGTADAVIIGDGGLHVIDLKYGKGVEVSAEGNPQLRLYALGALDMFPGIYDLDHVTMTIVQPRLGNVSSDTMTTTELYKWAHRIVAPAARLAASEDAPMHSGAWCRFCPARKVCKTRAEEAAELEDYRKKVFLSPEETAELLPKAELLSKWAEDLKDGALSRALEGEEIPGYKVVEGRSIRKYCKPDDEIVKMATAAGVDEALLWERRIITLTSLEALMGKKDFASRMKDCFEKPPGKPTLVPESDKRPAIVNTAAEDDFAGEFDQE